MLKVMSVFKGLWLAVVAIAAMVFVGCESDTGDGAQPVVVLDCYELNVDGNGGDMPIYYGIQHAVSGESLEVTTTAEWITIKNTDDSKIVLGIAVNESHESRYGVVNVNYKGIEKTINVYVTQDRAVLDKFSFEVSDVTYKSCNVRYIPKYEDKTYMANIIDQAYFEHSGVSTEQGFIDAEMTNYLSVAQSNDMTLEELMSNLTTPLIYTGVAERSFEGMQHGGKYLIYSYGVEISGNDYKQTTPIHYQTVELPMPTMYDVSFSLNLTTAVGNIVTLSIDPKEWDGYYNIQIAPSDSLYYVPSGAPLSDLTIRSLANAFYKSARSFMVQGNSADKFLSSHCYSGQMQVNLQLDPGRKYMIIVFAVESEDGAIPVMRSVPSLAYY